jgi:hypothetical protein
VSGGILFTRWFWPDWLSDTGVRACSAAARGVWMDMLCMMAEAGKEGAYGYLVKNGAPVAPKALSENTRVDPKTLRQLVAELEKNGVFSRDEEGRIYCRRMVREHRISEQNRQNGRRGGNPKLLDDKQKKGRLTGAVKGGVSPIGSKPLSTNHYPEEGMSEPDGSAIGVEPTPREAFEAYNRRAVELGLPIAKALNEKRRKSIRARLKAHPGTWGEAIEALGAPFCLGQNDRKWKADLDFLLQPSSYLRLIEGFYRNLHHDDRSQAERKRDERVDDYERAFAATGERTGPGR